MSSINLIRFLLNLYQEHRCATLILQMSAHSFTARQSFLVEDIHDDHLALPKPSVHLYNAGQGPPPVPFEPSTRPKYSDLVAPEAQVLSLLHY